MQSKTFCVMPHIGMSIQNHGDLCVCNRNDQSLKNQHQEVLFIHKDRLKDSWTSPTRKLISELLDSGIRMSQNEDNHHCQDCYDAEESGHQSQRQRLNESFKDVTPLPNQPRVLIIKPGNVCNLACRMCNPETSSSWYTDAYQLAVKHKGITESFAKYTKNFEHIRNGFNKDNINFWNDLNDWLPGLVFLDIYGGEPFLSSELFKVLGNNVTPENTSLQLHTNLTLYNEQYLEILSRYKSVDIGLSIDSHIPAQLNYIRYPVDSSIILKNLEKFNNFFSSYTNVSKSITTTITNLNIFNVDEIYENLSNYNMPVNLNFVAYPIEYDIRILPDEIKFAILEKNPNFKKNCNDYFLQNKENAKVYFQKFWEITKDLDTFRNQSFEKLFSEYFQILSLHLQL